MKEFKEMWKAAQGLGVDIEGLAETFYTTMKNHFMEDEIQVFLNILREINGYQKYLTEEKAENSDITKVMNKLKHHKHSEGQVVLPME